VINRWRLGETMPEPIFQARIRDKLMLFYSFTGNTGEHNTIIGRFLLKNGVMQFGLLTPRGMDTDVSSLREGLESVDQTQPVSQYVQDQLDGLKLLKSLESEGSQEGELSALRALQDRLAQTGN
jgi:hypothetical protein